MPVIPWVSFVSAGTPYVLKKISSTGQTFGTDFLIKTFFGVEAFLYYYENDAFITFEE